MLSVEPQSGDAIPTPRNCRTSMVVSNKMYLLGGMECQGALQNRMNFRFLIYVCNFVGCFSFVWFVELGIDFLACF